MSYPPETPPAGDLTAEQAFQRLVAIQTALRAAEEEHQRIIPLASEAARLWAAAQVETMASPTPENVQREATARSEHVRLGEELAALRQRTKVAHDGIVHARTVWERATAAARAQSMKTVHDHLQPQVKEIVSGLEDGIAKLGAYYIARGMRPGRAVDVLAAAVRGDENFENRIAAKTKQVFDNLSSRKDA